MYLFILNIKKSSFTNRTFNIYKLFTIKLLLKCFEFFCSLLMPYWLGLYVLRRTCRQNRLYETLFHTVIILSKHHHHTYMYIPIFQLYYSCWILMYTHIYIHTYMYLFIFNIIFVLGVRCLGGRSSLLWKVSYMYIYICIYVCEYKYMYIHTYLYMYIYVCMCICIYIHICIFRYIYFWGGDYYCFERYHI
jgi:hypothetical protein